MAVTLNTSGESHLKSLIGAGKYNTGKEWNFTAEDGDALLGSGGADWARYGSVHLGIDHAEAGKTKAHWKYPAAKAKGDSEEVYRSGLVAAKQRAAQQGAKDIENAAGSLIDLIDEKDGKDKENAGEDKGEGGSEAAAEAKPAAQAEVPVMPGARIANRDLPRLMTRIFGTPLLIAPEKLEIIMSAIGPRLGVSPLSNDKQADALGAFLGLDDENGETPEDMPYSLTADGIAVIEIEGTLVYKSSWLGALSGLTSYGEIGSALDKAMADPSVKGVLLSIDSYGGEVNGCFDLSDAIYAAREQKPVYGVSSDDSYSAAYALLSACSKVFVSRTSGVGSVGVVALHIDQSAADKMRGLSYTYIYSGARKIDGNPHEPLSNPALQTIQAEVDRLRAMFAGAVAKYRGMTAEAVLATQAACFHGENAVGAKFADALGTKAEALAALRAEISAKPPAIELTAENTNGPEQTAKPSRINSAIVVDLDAVRSAARGEAAASHVEIVSLCMAAGLPDRAADFIAKGASVAAVREKLQDLRAEASDARAIHGHIMPDAGDGSAQAIATGWDNAIRAICGRLKEN